MLRFDKMTVKAQEALQQAQEVAARHENQSVEPVHLLAALVEQQDGVVPPLIARLGRRLYSWQGTGKTPARAGMRHNMVVPYGAYACADGPVNFAIQNEREWDMFCKTVLQRPGRFACEDLFGRVSKPLDIERERGGQPSGQRNDPRLLRESKQVADDGALNPPHPGRKTVIRTRHLGSIWSHSPIVIQRQTAGSTNFSHFPASGFAARIEPRGSAGVVVIRRPALLGRGSEDESH